MSKKKRKKKLGTRSKQQPNHVKQIKSKLHEIFSVNDGRSYGYRELIRKLQLRDKKSKDYLKSQLFSLESNEKIRRLSDGRFVTNAESEYIQGTVDHVNPNFAYIVTPDQEEDIWVKTTDLNFAIHGDSTELHSYRRHSHRQSIRNRIYRADTGGPKRVFSYRPSQSSR